MKKKKTASQIYQAKVKKARKEADKIWGQIILLLHPKCEYSPCKNKSTDPHHFCPKSISNILRYNTKNGVGLCRGHHFSHHNGNPFIQQDVIRKRGEKWFEYIKKEKEKIVKYSISLKWYEGHIQKLNKELIKIQKNESKRIIK